MSWRHALIAVLGYAALLSTAPASAQQVQAPANRWVVDGGNIRCSLARRIGGPGSPILILSSYLGRDEPQFLLLRDGPDELPRLPRRVRIVLAPGDRSEEVRPVPSRAETVRAIVIEGLSEGFFDRFAAAESIRMERDGRDYVSMRTPGAARAVTALRACNDDLLRSWGIDMALRATLIRKPRAISGVINDTDYPLEARRNEQSGVTVINFIINVDGTLSDCRTAVSSGWPVLDAAACQLMTARFRYQPALGADGRAVAIREVRTITWLYPD